MTQGDSQAPLEGRELIAKLLEARYVTSLLTALIRLEIPEQLAAGPKTVAELASAVGAKEWALERALQAAANVGLVGARSDGRYETTATLDVVRADAQDLLRDVLLAQAADWHLRAWGALDWSIRTGRPASFKHYGVSMWEWLEKNPEDATAFNRLMTRLSTDHCTAVVDAYDFSPFSHIVDVAGGAGRMLASILARHTNARGTLFDLPRVIDVAKASTLLAPFSDRCTFVGGSFFDGVPQGADAYLLKHILHDWDAETAATLLTNIRRAMKPGGVVLVAERVFDRKDNAHLLLDIEMLTIAGGLERTEAQWRALFDSCGLELKRIIPTSSELSILEAG